MRKRFYLFSEALMLISTLVYAPKAFAQAPTSPAVTSPCPQNEISTDLGCVPEDPIGFVEKFYGIGLGFIGMVALLFMIIGGYYIMTSQGNPTKLATGKSFIFYALAGVVLGVFGFIFIQIVTGDILQIPGFN